MSISFLYNKYLKKAQASFCMLKIAASSFIHLLFIRFRILCRCICISVSVYQCPIVHRCHNWRTLLSNSQDVVDGEDRQQLVEGLLPHVGGEQRHDRGDVGDEPEQAQAGEQHTLAPELVLLPYLPHAALCYKKYLLSSKIFYSVL